MNVCVIGLWHQGVVAAACLADKGFRVVAVDPDAARIATLAKGHPPVFEPGLDDLLAKGIASGLLSFSTDFTAARDAELVTLMHDTPVNERDESDTTCIFEAARQAAPHLRPGAILWVTAQVPVMTCDRLREEILHVNPSASFGLAYSPENLRLGQAIERFMSPPLPVIGTDDPAVFQSLEKILAPFSNHWKCVSLRTGEMVKHALNGFLATCICFANELGNICDEVGADGFALADVLRMEPRVGAKAMLYPGLGFAGGTLARDMITLKTLGDRYGLETALLDGAWDSNKRQNGLVLRKVRKALGDDLTGRTVAVLGLTYKADTSTLRRSAALEVICELHAAGATVCASDPKADRDEVAQEKGFTFFDDPYAAAHDADMLVLMTPWKDYKMLDFPRLKAALRGNTVLDTAGHWKAPDVEAAGLVYLDIGRGRGVAKGV